MISKGWTPEYLINSTSVVEHSEGQQDCSSAGHNKGSDTALCNAGEQVIFRVRRPMYLISSTIIVEDGEGNEIGEVKQRWHLWKRKYDLYFGRRQFADIQGQLPGLGVRPAG